MTVKWVDSVPPANQRGRKKTKPVKPPVHDAFARALRKRPGVWAQLEGRRHAAVAFQINRGIMAAFRPAGAYEAVSRNTGTDGRATIYVRYVGHLSEDQKAANAAFKANGYNFSPEVYEQIRSNLAQESADE